ncbi:MAG: DUF2807 domain-containing protein, partial [Candidatus Eremiobacteraeota bacterium]|nr:DUF2807 domain-containing protein [Candidatus Eremiobacteraeota bacterium]
MNAIVWIAPFAHALVLALALGVAGSALLAAAVWSWIRVTDTTATTRHVLWWIALGASALLPLMCLSSSLGHVQHGAAPTLAAPRSDVASARGARRVRPTESTQRLAYPHASTHSVLDVPAGAGGLTKQLLTLDRTMTLAAATPAQLIATGAAVARTPPFDFVVILVWCALAAIRTAALARRVAALRTVKRDAHDVDDALARKLRRWRHSSRTGRPVRLRVSGAVDVPVAVGFRAPVILLPLKLVHDEESADLDQIALHEYAHLNRYDDWTNLAERALSCVLWFNPVIALCVRRISLEREIACDDWVVAQTGRAHRYATCLWKLVETTRLPARSILAPGALFTSKQIVTRIERLLDSRRNALPRLSPLGAFIVGSLGIAIVITAGLRAPVIALQDLRATRDMAQTAPATRQERAMTDSRADVPAVRSHEARSLARVSAPAPTEHESSAHPTPARVTSAYKSPGSLRLPERPRRARGLTTSTVPSMTIHAHRVNSQWRAREPGYSPLRTPDMTRERTAAPAPPSARSLGAQIATSVDMALRDANVEGKTREALSKANATLDRTYDTRAVQVALAQEHVADASPAFVRDLPPFHRIVLETGVRVEVRRSSRSRVDFHGATVTARHTTTDVSNGTLTIDGQGSWSDDEGALVTIETPALDGIDVDGSSTVTVGAFDGDHLALAMNGSGRIDVTGGSAHSTAITIAGSG